jgi:hypothetical protein
VSAILLCAALLAAVLAAGCNSSASSGGEPKPLPPGRIPKGAGPGNR